MDAEKAALLNELDSIILRLQRVLDGLMIPPAGGRLRDELLQDAGERLIRPVRVELKEGQRQVACRHCAATLLEVRRIRLHLLQHEMEDEAWEAQKAELDQLKASQPEQFTWTIDLGRFQVTILNKQLRLVWFEGGKPARTIQADGTERAFAIPPLARAALINFIAKYFPTGVFERYEAGERERVEVGCTFASARFVMELWAKDGEPVVEVRRKEEGG